MILILIVERHRQSRVLGHVHGDVGLLYQLRHVRSVVGKDRRADACVHVQRQPIAQQRRVQRLLQALAQVCHGEPVQHRGQKEGELVPAQSRDHVGGAQKLGQAPGDLLQHQVADVMAKGVVDLLEPVEIDNQQGEPVARAPGPATAVVHAIIEERPIGKARQRIVERLVFQRIVVCLLIGDVADVGDLPGPAVIDQLAHRDFDGKGRLVHPMRHHLATAYAGPRRGAGIGARHESGGVRYEAADMAANQRLRAVVLRARAEHLPGGGVGVQDDPDLIE